MDIIGNGWIINRQGEYMVKDLELIKDITPLFTKKSIVWGIGQKGRLLIEEMRAMGAGKEGMLLCDSDCRKWGEAVCNMTILPPTELFRKIEIENLRDWMMLISVQSVQVQNEIINSIQKMCGGGYDIDIYTWYALEQGMDLNIQNPHVDNEYRKKKLTIQEKNVLPLNEQIRNKINGLKYFAFLPLHHDEVILIHSMGKTGSSSLYRSIQSHGRNALHCHVLSGLGDDKDDIYNIVNSKSGKIISLVRDPVARQISAMWQNFWNRERYSSEADFYEIEKYYFERGKIEKIFNWFEWELKNVLHADVLAHPFNTEMGYSIIKQDNIEILLMRTDKLNGLEKVTGDFLNIDQFHIHNANVGEEKAYRFALRSYIDNFCISKEELEEIYINNEYMKHFFSEDERNALFKKWMKYSK